MTFQPGQSGNPGGRPKDRPFKTALMMELKAAENGEECVAPKGSLRWNVRRLIEQGDVQTIKEIADRLDGKPAQAIIGDSDEDPIGLLHRIERVIVDPRNQDAASVPAAPGAGEI